MEKEIFKAFKQVIEHVAFRAENDLVERNMNYGLLLAAYNQYLEDENCGNGRIFNLTLPTDLRYIVNNDLLSVDRIGAILNNEETTFRITSVEGDFELLKKENIVPLIVEALPKIIACAIMYAHRDSNPHSAYKQVLENYFTGYFEEYIQYV